MKCHDNFRLWLTAEVHPKFPTILLQSSLKLTYEVRPQKTVIVIILQQLGNAFKPLGEDLNQFYTVKF